VLTERWHKSFKLGIKMIMQDFKTRRTITREPDEFKLGDVGRITKEYTGSISSPTIKFFVYVGSRLVKKCSNFEEALEILYSHR
jgi:hypothetical protein